MTTAHQARVHETMGARATCTCGWYGPMRSTVYDAWPDRDRHNADHEAVAAGYERTGRIGVNEIASHRHEAGGTIHKHDGGGRPHQHVTTA